VAATSSTAAWALGQINDRRTLILHWNGTAWKQVPSPSNEPGAVLYSVAAISARDAWAVILHWNGATWKRVPIASTISLGGVAATSADNALAVGNTHPSRDVYKIAILHWNGTAWNRR